MGAFGFAVNVFHLAFGEKFVETAVAFEEEILAAAGEPEEFRGSFREEVSRIFGDGGAKGSEGREHFGVTEADVEGLAAAHGEAGDSAGFGDAVLGFDGGHDVLEDVVFKKLGIFGLHVTGGAEGDGVAEGHDDDHGYRFVFGQQIVEDEVGMAGEDPAAGGVVGAVEEIEHGVFLSGLCIPRGGIDPEGAEFVTDGFSMLPVDFD